MAYSNETHVFILLLYKRIYGLENWYMHVLGSSINGLQDHVDYDLDHVDYDLKNSLIIHEQNTKEIIAATES